MYILHFGPNANINIYISIGDGFKHVCYFYHLFGGNNPNLTIVFFRWVGGEKPPARYAPRFFSNTKLSGQIIATSHDLTPNGGLLREIPLFQENPGW